MSPSIIILTGPPGSGKAAIADILARKSPHKSVHLRADDFFGWVRAGYTSPDQQDARAQNHVGISAAAMASSASARMDGRCAPPPGLRLR